MKNAKRILIAILAIALVASVFAFSVSAEDEVKFRGEGIAEFDDILEYYEMEDFIALDFVESNWDTDLWKDKEHTSSTTKHYPRILVETIADAADPTNMILNTALPYAKGAGFKLEDTTNALTDQMFVSFDVTFDESCLNNMHFSVEVTPTKGSAANMLRFDFGTKKGTVGVPTMQYTAWDAQLGTFDSEAVTVDGFAPEVGVQYSIELCFNAVKDKAYINIEAEGKEPFRVEYDITGAEGIKAIDVFGKFDNTGITSACTSASAHEKNVANHANLTESDKAYACGAGKCRASITADYHMDNLKIYEGSFARKADKFEITKITLEDFRTFYESGILTFEEKFALANVLTKLYSFDSTVFPDEVAAVLPEGPAYVNEIYASETITRVGGIDKSADYYTRCDYVDYAIAYDSYLPADDQLAGLPGMTDELVAQLIAARAVVAEEAAELTVIKDQSEAFIQHMASYDPAVKDYYALNAFYNQAASDDYAKRAPEYIGMEQYTAIYEELANRVEVMNDDVYAFVNHVTSMEYAASFGFLFAAYEDATESYYKYGEAGVINPGLDNDSYPAIKEKIDYYLMKAPFIQEKARECDEFIAIIDEAKSSSYYTVLVGKLEAAAPYLAIVQNDYPGVSEAVELYYALSESVVDAANASEAYIAAVKAIEGKTEFYEKKAAVEAALVLKEHGDVPGYEGVKEANVALAEAEADINFREGNSKTLINLIAKIKSAKTLSEKREYIRLAIIRAEGADEGYTGVTEAKAALQDAIKAFEEAVSQANKGVTEANKVAQGVAASVNGANIFH